MVRGDVLLAEALGEVARHALGEPAGVDEHERGAVRADELGDAVVHLVPDCSFDITASSGERGSSSARSSSRAWPVSTIAQPRRVAPAPTRKRAISSIGFCVADRPMRVGGSPHERLEPLEREREVRAALVAGDGVDLVDDHGAHRAQHLAAASRW